MAQVNWHKIKAIKQNKHKSDWKVNGFVLQVNKFFEKKVFIDSKVKIMTLAHTGDLKVNKSDHQRTFFKPPPATHKIWFKQDLWDPILESLLEMNEERTFETSECI